MRRLGDLRQHLTFVAAGIGDLVPYGDPSDADESRCPECDWIWAEGAVRCAGCGYPELIA